MTSRPTEICMDLDFPEKDKWSCEHTSCQASTSRGLSHSSGDYDGSDKYSYSSELCSSCESIEVDFQYRPCSIVDSSLRLNNSKWRKFKRYLKRKIIIMRIRLSNKNGKTETRKSCIDEKQNKAIKGHSL